MDWFYADAGKQVGPIDEASFELRVSTGIVHDDTLVWHAGMPNWQPYRTVRPVVQPGALLPPAIPGETQFCSECGRAYAPDDLVAFGSSLVCASCKPAFMQKLREGIRPANAARYGGFWIRFLAVILDGLLSSVVLVIVAMIAVVVFPIDFTNFGRTPPDLMMILAFEGVVWMSVLLFGAAYETWMIGRFAATLGKMACGLTVVRADGAKLSYPRALGRHFAKHLSSFALCIGYIMAGFDDEKRALHDRICDTRVIKK